MPSSELKRAGVKVRAFNRPSLAVGDPFGVVQRDHRKLVVADGEVAYVGGFCIGDEWAGTREIAPWRDTGVELRGPAARAAALTFERLWGEMGEPTFLAATLPARGGRRHPAFRKDAIAIEDAVSRHEKSEAAVVAQADVEAAEGR